jgi:hypothetical protein
MIKLPSPGGRKFHRLRGRSRSRPRKAGRWEPLDEDPPLASARALMQRFRPVARDHDLEGLDGWLDDAANSELPPLVGFTRGIATDRDSVVAAFALPGRPVQRRATCTKSSC